jgi:hypothetical protein
MISLVPRGNAVEKTVRSVFLVALVWVTGLPWHARGEPIAYEGFDYKVGSNLNGSNGGTGFVGPWNVDQYNYVIGAGSLSDSSNLLSSSGNALRHEGSQPRARRTLNRPLGDAGTTVYCSFLLREDAAGKDRYHDFGGLILGGSNTALAYGIGGLYIGADGPTNLASRFVIGSAGDAKAERGSQIKVVVGKSTLLVVRIDFLDGPDKATLHINPTPGESEPAHGIVYSGTDFGRFSQLAISQGNNSSWTTDEIRIATTWGEVTPKAQLIDTVSHPSRSFDDLTEKLLDETVSKLKGAQAKQVSELKQKYKKDSDAVAQQHAELSEEMQREVLKVMALAGVNTREISQGDLDTIKKIDNALEKAGKEPDSTLAMPQCKKEILTALDKNNAWDEETRTRQYEIISAAPPEKRKRLVGIYSKFEPKFAAQIQRESADAEQYKKDLLKIVVPDTGDEK